MNKSSSVGTLSIRSVAGINVGVFGSGLTAATAVKHCLAFSSKSQLTFCNYEQIEINKYLLAILSD